MSVTDRPRGYEVLIRALVATYDETARAHEAARLDLAEGMLKAHQAGMTKTAILAATGHRFPWSTLQRLLRVAAGEERAS